MGNEWGYIVISETSYNFLDRMKGQPNKITIQITNIYIYIYKWFILNNNLYN